MEFHDIDELLRPRYNAFTEFHEIRGRVMKVCFIGHRTVTAPGQIKLRLETIVLELIAAGADTFLFGSRSEFDQIAWEVVTQLQKQYPYLQRVAHNAPHETVFLSRAESQRYEQIYYQQAGRRVYFPDYEQAVNAQHLRNATKNVYLARNQMMIDDSDVGIFYYDYRPRGGAAAAFAYAKQKKKKIINLYC